MKEKMKTFLPAKLLEYIDNDNFVTELNYPQTNTLEKIISINLGKTPEISGKLTGIKGQYIILDNCEIVVR